MGGIPLFALVSIGIPPAISIKECEQIYQGIKKASRKYNVAILGGDTVASPQNLFISISLIGEVEKSKLTTRSKAQVGDRVLVSGHLGGSILKKHFSFQPRIELSRYLVNNFKISAMLDISDGLASEAIKLAKMSEKGILLLADKIPISSSVKKLNKKSRQDPLNQALYNGEDYELLFTTSPKNVSKIIRGAKNKLNIKVTDIGEITSKTKNYKLCYENKNIALKDQGFDHFR
jgi:thiamine-monophosphate kinase